MRESPNRKTTKGLQIFRRQIAWAGLTHIDNRGCTAIVPVRNRSEKLHAPQMH